MTVKVKGSALGRWTIVVVALMGEGRPADPRHFPAGVALWPAPAERGNPLYAPELKSAHRMPRCSFRALQQGLSMRFPLAV